MFTTPGPTAHPSVKVWGSDSGYRESDIQSFWIKSAELGVFPGNQICLYRCLQGAI